MCDKRKGNAKKVPLRLTRFYISVCSRAGGRVGWLLFAPPFMWDHRLCASCSALRHATLELESKKRRKPTLIRCVAVNSTNVALASEEAGFVIRNLTLVCHKSNPFPIPSQPEDRKSQEGRGRINAYHIYLSSRSKLHAFGQP